MYIPRELIECICTTSKAKTISLDRDAPTRHLDNSTFATLVRNGWVGTRGLATAEIGALLKGALAGGRGLVIARQRKGDAVGDLDETWGELGLL